MPDLCEITGTVYDAAGAALAGVRLTVKEVRKDGLLVSDDAVDYASDEDGVITFSVPRASTVKVQGGVVGLTRDTWLTVPDAASANLEDLITVTAPPTSTQLAQ